MAEYLIQSETLDAIADAIHAKTGGSAAMTPAEMADAIGSISSGVSKQYTKLDTFTLQENVRQLVIDISQFPYNDYLVKVNATATGADYLYINPSGGIRDYCAYINGNTYARNVIITIVPPNDEIGNSKYIFAGSVSNGSHLNLNNRPAAIYFVAYRDNGVLNAGSTFELFGR